MNCLQSGGEETFGTEIKEDDGNDSPDEKKEPVYTINRKVNYIDRETGAELKIKDDVQTASVSQESLENISDTRRCSSRIILISIKSG